jgi:hypothetical protein
VLSAPVQSFAYPFGSYDAWSLDLARRYFDCACSANLGLVTPRSPLYALERLDAYYLRTASLFDLIFTRYFDSYVGARALLRRVRRLLPLDTAASLYPAG